jgi:hypothetical protein
MERETTEAKTFAWTKQGREMWRKVLCGTTVRQDIYWKDQVSSLQRVVRNQNFQWSFFCAQGAWSRLNVLPVQKKTLSFGPVKGELKQTVLPHQSEKSYCNKFISILWLHSGTHIRGRRYVLKEKQKDSGGFFFDRRIMIRPKHCKQTAQQIQSASITINTKKKLVLANNSRNGNMKLPQERC